VATLEELIARKTGAPRTRVPKPTAMPTPADTPIVPSVPDPQPATVDVSKELRSKPGDYYRELLGRTSPMGPTATFLSNAPSALRDAAIMAAQQPAKLAGGLSAPFGKVLSPEELDPAGEGSFGRTFISRPFVEGAQEVRDMADAGEYLTGSKLGRAAGVISPLRDAAGTALSAITLGGAPAAYRAGQAGVQAAAKAGGNLAQRISGGFRGVAQSPAGQAFGMEVGAPAAMQALEVEPALESGSQRVLQAFGQQVDQNTLPSEPVSVKGKPQPYASPLFRAAANTALSGPTLAAAGMGVLGGAGLVASRIRAEAPGIRPPNTEGTELTAPKKTPWYMPQAGGKTDLLTMIQRKLQAAGGRVQKATEWLMPDTQVLEGRLANKAGEAPARAVSDAFQRVKETGESLPSAMSDAIDARLDSLPDLQQRKVGQMLDKLPIQRMPKIADPETLASNGETYAAQWRKYYDDAIARANGVYVGPEHAETNKAYAEIYAHARVAEEIGGQPPESWYNYVLSRAERAELNKRELALRTDPAYYDDATGRGDNASGPERLVRDVTEKRLIQKRLKAISEPGQKERFDRAQTAEAALKSEFPVEDLAPQKKTLQSLIETKAARRALELEKKAKLREVAQEVKAKLTPQDRAAITPEKLPTGQTPESFVGESMLPERSTADFGTESLGLSARQRVDSIGPQLAQEGVSLILPNKGEKMAFKNFRVPMKPTEIVELGPSGRKTLVPLPEGLPEGERTRTAFVEPGAKAGARRPVTLPPQPTEAAPAKSSRLLSAEEIAAEKLAKPDVALAALREQEAKLQHALDAAGLSPAQKRQLAHLNHLQRTVEINRAPTAGEETAMRQALTAIEEKLGRREKVSADYAELMDAAQRNYKLGGQGHLKRVYASRLEKQYKELAAQSETASSLLPKGRQELRREPWKKGFTKRTDDKFQQEAPIRYPQIPMKESLQQNFRLRAFDDFANTLADSPFLKEGDAGAAMGKERGWVQVPDTANHGGLRGKWLDPDVWNAYADLADLRSTKPGAIAQGFQDATGWMSGMKAAKNTGVVASNLMGMAGQMWADLGIPLHEIPGVLRRGLTGTNDPVHWQDVQRLGLTHLVEKGGKTRSALDKPNAGGNPLAARPEANMQSALAAQEAASAARKSTVKKVTDIADAAMELNGSILQTVFGEGVATYADPARIGEVFRNSEVAARQGAYLWLRDHGMDHATASRRMREALIDYSDKSGAARTVESFGIGGAGNRFIHFLLASTSRGLHLLTDRNLAVGMRVAAFPLIIAGVNKALRDAYDQRHGISPERREEIERQRPDWQKGPVSGTALRVPMDPPPADKSNPYSLTAGGEELGREMHFGVNRAFPYNGALSYASGAMAAARGWFTPEEGGSDGRNAFTSMLQPMMPVTPLLELGMNHSMFYGGPILPTEKDYGKLPALSPQNLRLVAEYLGQAYLPEQIAYGRQQSTAGLLNGRAESGDVSIRGEGGLGTNVTPFQRLASDLSGIKVSEYSPEGRTLGLANNLNAQERAINKGAILQHPRLPISSGESAMKEAGRAYITGARRINPRAGYRPKE
jgi:hypothetical protein